MRSLFATLVLFLSVCLGTPAFASEKGNTIPRSTAMLVSAGASIPFGWLDFCARYDIRHEKACKMSGPIEIVHLTPQRWLQIVLANWWVNTNIIPTGDDEHWGVADQWDYPLDGKGDCEDYALMKRRMLVDAGFPPSALLMTVVKDGKGEGHALLTLVTDMGDYVLDNQRADVVPWDWSGYVFIKRQSPQDPNVWEAIAHRADPISVFLNK